MITQNVTNSTYKEFYCGDGLHRFQNSYRYYHGFISMSVCIFGSLANFLNIIVLTRPDMRSPTNSILTGLAIADLLVMIEYIPFSWHMYVRKQSRREQYNYYWSLFVLFHSNFAQVCHTISIWLTLLLAIWRYIAVSYPQRSRQWCSMRTTTISILLGYFVCPILCIPLYLAFNLESRDEILFTDVRNSVSVSININDSKLLTSLKNSSNDSSYSLENVTIYTVNLSELGRANNNFLSDLNFWIYSIVIKMIPCILLTILSLRLICALIDTKKRREKLASGPASKKKSSKSSKLIEKEKQTDRTTRMLLAVLLLFLLTEFPQGILGLLSMVLGQSFFEDCYNQLGEVMDILALINSGINFILYCFMSRQFRSNFQKLFVPKWLPIPQNNDLNELTNQTNHYTGTQVTQV